MYLLLFLIIYFNQGTCRVFLTRSGGREERIWSWAKFNLIFLLFYLFQNSFEREAEHNCHPELQVKLFYPSARWWKIDQNNTMIMKSAKEEIKVNKCFRVVVNI